MAKPPIASTLNLFVLYVRDLETSLDFYQCLGLTFHLEQHGKGPKHYSCQVGPTVIELYPAHAHASRTRLGFVVASVTDVLTKLEAQGYVSPTISSSQFAVVQDPDGNKVELQESPTAGP